MARISDFNDYLESNQTYIALEKFWINFFFSILASLNLEKSEWITPYYNTTFSNGEKFMDGNPIFSAKSAKTEKTIRIVQEEYLGHEEFSSWIDFSLEDEEFKNELVIVCVLSEASLEKTKKEVTNWLIC